MKNPNNNPNVLSIDPTPVHVTALLKAFPITIVKKGSEILIEEFPSNEDLIDTKDKIEKI